jgi:hypothetical protein
MRLDVRVISAQNGKGKKICVRAPDNSSVEFHCTDEALKSEIVHRLLAPEGRTRKPIFNPEPPSKGEKAQPLPEPDGGEA